MLRLHWPCLWEEATATLRIPCTVALSQPEPVGGTGSLMRSRNSWEPGSEFSWASTGQVDRSGPSVTCLSGLSCPPQQDPSTPLPCGSCSPFSMGLGHPGQGKSSSLGSQRRGFRSCPSPAESVSEPLGHGNSKLREGRHRVYHGLHFCVTSGRAAACHYSRSDLTVVYLHDLRTPRGG